MEIDAEIVRLSDLRSRLWSDGDPDGEVPALSARLTELYALRRSEAARQQHGDPDEIVYRARIESELERLMSD